MKLLKHNILAIIYLNFKMLPWRQAIKLPIDIGGKIKFMRTNGSIEIKGPVKSRMIKIGFQGSEMFPDETTVIDIDGILELKGDFIRIGIGSILRIEKNGRVILHHNSRIGAKSIILSENHVEIGENTGMSWNCQIMDTDTHSLQDIESKTIKQRYSPVKIGNQCWIGNHVWINKGTFLPDNTIVASCSLCNHDYSKSVPPYSVLGGIPAKLLSTGKKRMNDKFKC